MKKVGQLNYEIVEKYVDEIVAVEEDEIASAILLLLEIEKIVVEGAGAVSLAAVLNRKVRLEGKKILCLISGGNIDVNTLDRIITRGLAAEGRIARFTVRLKDRPGTLLSVMEVIKKMQVNVLDIIHHRFESAGPFGYVDVSITLETKGHPHIEEVRKALEDGGIPALRGRLQILILLNHRGHRDHRDKATEKTLHAGESKSTDLPCVFLDLYPL